MRRIAIAVLVTLAASACDRAPQEKDSSEAFRRMPVPAEHAEGKRLFEASCRGCHGEAALGTRTGPPLVHLYYEPNHHSDAAFQQAISSGVRAHHWSFGDMPPVTGVTPEQATAIIAYIRWLQRQAGIA